MKKFKWDEDCQTAFAEFKSFLTNPPLLSRPIVGETLYLCLSVGRETIASVLVREEEEEQRPIYYISRTLKGAELNYPTIDKLALAVVVTTKKLKPYFQGHTVIVRTNQPLKKALHRPETSGRLVSWSVQLGEHDIRYEPRTTLKAQALADFVAEMTEKPCDLVTEELTWNLFVDRASSEQGAGAGIVLLGPNKIIIEYAVHLSFKATNNVAEYEALLRGLEIATEVKAEKLRIHSDSQLVTSQVLGQFQTRDSNIAKYVIKAIEKLKNIEKNGGQWEIVPIPREENTKADAIAKGAASKSQLYLSTQMREERARPSVEEEQVLSVTVLDPWMQPIVTYLAEGTLPERRAEAAKLVRISSVSSLIEGVLYRTSVSHPWSKCISLEEGNYVLKEIHEGDCGSHEGAVTLYRKAMLQGFCWPTMKKDAEEMGPFTPARGQVKFIVVAVDHFTKWIEVQPMSTITSRKIQKWLSNEVMSRNPSEVLFSRTSANQWPHRGHESHHPLRNQKETRQLERQMVDELYHVIWAYRTTPRKATGETPFLLTYGTEAVLPVELGMTSLRVQVVDEDRHEESLKLCLDLLEERRHKVSVRAEAYHRQMAKYYNARVKERSFEEGDLVLKKSEIGRGAAGFGKLEANWDGPYRVIAVVGQGAYRIAHLDGTPLPRTWNVENLKKYLQ
ncbi:uncharacterized protein LOC126678235 [Mercurialis annua]|uniref:uncharacterized protein LOC126678235 n=1 Tax=Mercurialis annua TaxID=3986 RepID=UPI00215E5768|nr:uncharacterized protein LOC126678235 [Mercurialis annua]